MTDDSLPLNEQATATEDYEMISNNISDEQTFASINITILHVRLIPILMSLIQHSHSHFCLYLYPLILISIPILIFIPNPHPYSYPYPCSYSYPHLISTSLVHFFLSSCSFLFIK